MLAFRSLDPFRALREPDRRRRDEERLSRSEQRTLSKTQNNHLTGKAPYKFESTSLQRRVSEPSVPPNKFLRGFRPDRSPDLDGRRRGETLTPRWVQDLDSDRRRADPSRHCARAAILAVWILPLSARV